MWKNENRDSNCEKIQPINQCLVSQLRSILLGYNKAPFYDSVETSLYEVNTACIFDISFLRIYVIST